MKNILLTLMMLFLTSQIAMAKVGSSVEQLNKATHQGKTFIELIDKTSKNRNKQICVINIAKGKVKEKPC